MKYSILLCVIILSTRFMLVGQVSDPSSTDNSDLFPSRFEVIPIDPPKGGEKKNCFPLYSDNDTLYIVVTRDSDHPIDDLGVGDCRIYRRAWDDLNNPRQPWEEIEDYMANIHSLSCQRETNERELYISRAEGNYHRLFYKKDDKVREPVNLPGWEKRNVFFPCVSSDGKRLVFCSNKEGEDQLDLYSSDLNDKKWSKPKPFTHLNTLGNEIFPFFTENEQLYFSSNGYPETTKKYTVCFSNLKNGRWSKADFLPLPLQGEQAYWLGQTKWKNRFVFAAQKGNRFQLYTARDTAQSDNSSGRYLLLTIAVDKYDHWFDFDNCIKEADSLTRLLKEEFGFKPYKALNNPKYQDILDALDALSNDLEPTDNVLIFFSGHGGKDVRNERYWIPSDAGKDSIQHLNWLPVETIIEKFQDKPKRVLFVIDACHARILREISPLKGGPSEQKCRWAMGSSSTGKVVADNQYVELMIGELLATAKTGRTIDAQTLHGRIYEKYPHKKETLPFFGAFFGDEGGMFEFAPKR